MSSAIDVKWVAGGDANTVNCGRGHKRGDVSQRVGAHRNDGCFFQNEGYNIHFRKLSGGLILLKIYGGSIRFFATNKILV